MVINKINKQLNEVITALEDRNIQVKNKGKLIGKLRSSRDLANNLARTLDGNQKN